MSSFALFLQRSLSSPRPRPRPRPREPHERLRGADEPANERTRSARPFLLHHGFPYPEPPPTFPSSQPGCGRAQVFFIKGFIADSQPLAEEGCGSYLILHPTPRLSRHGGQVTEQPVLSHCQPFSGKPLTLTQRSPKTQLQVPSSFPPTHRPHRNSQSIQQSQ